MTKGVKYYWIDPSVKYDNLCHNCISLAQLSLALVQRRTPSDFSQHTLRIKRALDYFFYLDHLIRHLEPLLRSSMMGDLPPGVCCTNTGEEACQLRWAYLLV